MDNSKFYMWNPSPTSRVLICPHKNSLNSREFYSFLDKAGGTRFGGCFYSWWKEGRVRKFKAESHWNLQLVFCETMRFLCGQVQKREREKERWREREKEREKKRFQFKQKRKLWPSSLASQSVSNEFHPRWINLCSYIRSLWCSTTSTLRSALVSKLNLLFNT